MLVTHFFRDLIPAHALADPAAHPPAPGFGSLRDGLAEGLELLAGVAGAGRDSTAPSRGCCLTRQQLRQLRARTNSRAQPVRVPAPTLERRRGETLHLSPVRAVFGQRLAARVVVSGDEAVAHRPVAPSRRIVGEPVDRSREDSRRVISRLDDDPRPSWLGRGRGSGDYKVSGQPPDTEKSSASRARFG